MGEDGENASVSHIGLELVPITSAHIPWARTCHMATSSFKKDREMQSLAMQQYSQPLKRKERSFLVEANSLDGGTEICFLASPPGDSDVNGTTLKEDEF